MTDEEFSKKYPTLAARKKEGWVDSIEIVVEEEVSKVFRRPERFLPRRIAKLDKESHEFWVNKERKRKRDWYAKNKELVSEKRKNDPKERERNKERSKRRYHANPKLYNARKTEWCRKNKTKFRAHWNAWYERVKHTKRGQQLESRIRNRPLYGLTGALRDFERGTIGVDELNRLYDRALARVNDVGSRRGKTG